LTFFLASLIIFRKDGAWKSPRKGRKSQNYGSRLPFALLTPPAAGHDPEQVDSCHGRGEDVDAAFPPRRTGRGRQGCGLLGHRSTMEKYVDSYQIY